MAQHTPSNPNDPPSIALDARYIRAPFSGIARHTQNLLVGLREIEDLEPIVVITDDQTIIDPAINDDQRFQLLHVDSGPTSMTGQIRVARMLRARLDNILTYLKHGVTNAVSESLNSRIQWVKATARGFRNQQNFITAIYFHCGGLDLDPRGAAH